MLGDARRRVKHMLYASGMATRNLDDDPFADLGPKPASSEAETLACPGCGAPAEFEARTCRHCRAELATVRCGACFGLERTGRKHCSHCSALLALEGIEGPFGAKCPRCVSPELIGVQVGGHRVGECMHCTGLFVHHDVLETITRRTEENGGLRLRPFTGKPSEPEKTAYLSCPTCTKQMGRRGFADHSGVVIDFCTEHGVWFDQGELARVLEFVDAGGLARIEERERRAAALKRVMPTARIDPSQLESYDMVASFFRSLLR
jgi:Zn-finger nucleic acid-binding protein